MARGGDDVLPTPSGAGLLGTDIQAIGLPVDGSLDTVVVIHPPEVTGRMGHDIDRPVGHQGLPLDAQAS